MTPKPSSAVREARRSSRTALLVLLPGLLLGGTNLTAQPPANPGSDHPSRFDPNSVKVELGGLFVEDPKKPSRPKRKMEEVSMALQAHGLPSHLVIKVDRVDASLKTQAGKTLPIHSRTHPTPLSSPAVTAAQAALGDVRLYAADDLTFDIVPMFSLPRPLVQEHWTDPLQFSATLDLQAAEYQVQARRPLKTIPFQRDESNIEVRNEDLAVGKPQTDHFEAAGEVIQILQNPTRKEALLGRPRFAFHPATSTLTLSGWTFLNEDSPSGTLLTPEWLADAEVVTLHLHKVASFQRTFLRDPLQLSFDLPGQRGKTSDYDAQALEDLTLPRGATRQQMRDYVDAILAISRKQKNFGYEDPQVAMLMKVGPHNLDILIDAAPAPRTWKDLHIWKAMREMVQEKKRTAHRDLILMRLANHPDLTELLSYSDWQEAARPILLQGLEDGRDDLTSDWIKSILSFRDPKTYPALTQYYLRNPTEPGLYEAIRTVPGIELGPIMGDAWKKAKEGTIRQQSFAIHPACEWGVPDALATAAEWLRPSATDYQHRVGRAVFKNYTPVEGTDEEMLAWFDTHKATLRFDTDRKIFLPGAAR